MFCDVVSQCRAIHHLSVSPLAVRRARRAIVGIAESLGTRAADRRGGVLAEVAAVDSEMASDATLLGNLVFMARAGSQDVAGLLTWILAILGDRREVLERLRVAGADATLASRVVLETLRLRQSEYINRVAVGPVEIDGFVVPAGWAVRICVRESHRDPRVHARPGEFDPDRFLGGVPPPTEYAPFGMLRHACIGDHLTRAVGRAFVEELASGYDLEVTGSGPARMGRAHWEPDRRFRVRLTPREQPAPFA